ncbi:succinate dehydrogenase assembly factor 2, mitochondrial [Mangifera indica]|uniref:succinate dehydrogenase assembly factor 2, mitochondrial n=1 Tax=Mangifera indica TaxID=29780 RepID=UPI001CFA90F9|nr:succinate dehydrogenase assembly factor 2, mitochondrial [Mangifera indica]
MASLRRAAINAHRIITSSALHNRKAILSSSPSRFETLLRPQYRWVSPYSSDSSQRLDVDFSNEESKRRLFNRLLYRSKQRGFLELDLVLGRWVEEHIHSMDENGIKALVDVLDLENPDLWKWLIGQEQPPDAVKTNPVFSAVHRKVMDNLNNHASPETRATPGEPWVRGWDDFKKGRDAPLSGNQ